MEIAELREVQTLALAAPATLGTLGKGKDAYNPFSEA
jgi:hypothetical protein